MKKKLINLLFMGALTAFLMACNDDDGTSAFDLTGIPDNSEAGPSPYVDAAETNARIPNVGFSLDAINGYKIVNMNMTGIYDKQTGNWLDLQGTLQSGQNIWLEIDGVPRSIKTERVTVARSSSKPVLDLVFLVDNSGSMGEEADSIAAEIADWSAELETMFDLKLGCVGYAESNLSGGLDLGPPSALYDFLNRSYGTYRTKGYDETNGETLKTLVGTGDYYTGGECGAAALHFADRNFNFRSNANRLYVNFTDEPNQPNGKEDFSVESVSENGTWDVYQGTIHTVFSNESYKEKPDDWWEPLYDEKPWLMSEYTGGETMFAPSDFAGISLSTLTVTDAIRNTSEIKFHFTDDLKTGTHTVKITILTPDKSVKAVREFTNVDFNR